MKEQTATSTAGVCYAVGWDERAESRAGGRVIRAGISGGFAEGEVAMEESRAGDGGAGGRAGGGAEGIGPRNMAPLHRTRAPGPSPLDTYPAAARTACQLATGPARAP